MYAFTANAKTAPYKIGCGTMYSPGAHAVGSPDFGINITT
jgi:hypothetical protein